MRNINIFKEYIDYVKDNPNGYWFKRKLYGWGWVPATREGWFVTLGFILLILLNAFRIQSATVTDAEVLKQVIIPTFILAGLLILICVRTGEPPKWSWGFPKDRKDRRKGN